jgi:hypothetical protein
MIRDQKKSLYVSFGTVQGVAIYLPTRGTAYKIHSNLSPGSSFVLEPELLFGPETAVWVLLPGAISYIRAIVVSGTITQEESSVRYTVCSADAMEAFHDIDDQFVIYRGDKTTPPPGAIPTNPAIDEKVNIDDHVSQPRTACIGVSEVRTANQMSPNRLLRQVSPSAHEEPGSLNAPPCHEGPCYNTLPVACTATTRDETNVPQQASSAFQTQADGCDDKREDSPTLVDTRNGAAITSPRQSAVFHKRLLPVSPLRQKIVLDEDSREQPPHAKRIRSHVLSSPEPGEVFNDHGPSICQPSGHQDVITKVSNNKKETEIASISQRDNDVNSTRLAAATADRHCKEEMETRSIQIPNWAPSMMFLKGMYQM